MSTVIAELEAFRQYVVDHARIDDNEISLEDLFQRWSVSRQAEAESKQSLQSLRRGLADADAERLVDVDVEIKETRALLLQK
jgi:hypothetical protein